MQGIDERSPLGNRILHLAQKHNISDFYITPLEQLSYRMNGDLVIDSFIYQPDQPLEIKPGTLDYAMQIGPLRFRVNQLVTRGRLRWVMRLLPNHIPAPHQISLPMQALKAYLENAALLYQAGVPESQITSLLPPEPVVTSLTFTPANLAVNNHTAMPSMLFTVTWNPADATSSSGIGRWTGGSSTTARSAAITVIRTNPTLASPLPRVDFFD